MPWWISTYFALYITFGLWSVSDDLKSDNVSFKKMALEIISDVFLLVSALCYWLPTVYNFFQPLTFILYLVGVTSFSFFWYISFKEYVLNDNEIPLSGKWFVGSTGTVAVIVVSLPMLYFGFQASLGHVYVGT